MKNPLIKRLPRELKSECGKYTVIFLFLVGMIGIISGFLVAGESMLASYNESFEKYNIENGNFEISENADTDLKKALEDIGVKIYPNFYVEEETQNIDSTLRIYINREEVDKICLMEGNFPKNNNEIAIDRMYADNNSLKTGDNIIISDKEFTISGLVAFSDYSALFSNNSDMMFDAVKFGTAIVTNNVFKNFEKTHLHYNYAWKYDHAPTDDKQANEMADAVMNVLFQNTEIVNFTPEYLNQAIHFTGNDMTRDGIMMTAFLYIAIIIIAFIFAITTSNTISKDANVIGTLRASGYSKSQLVRHYITMPMIITLIAALVGNVLGYTFFKDIMADMYYSSYSLPTFITKWNYNAFIKTTLIPLAIIFAINFLVLVRSLSLSPLKFIRRDLSRRKKKKAFRLNTKIPIMSRFRIRIILQNLPNYAVIFVGIFFANVLLLFGLMLNPLIDNYAQSITSNIIAQHQYILKAPVETSDENAEKFNVTSLQTTNEDYLIEDVSIYGVASDSRFIKEKIEKDKIYISSAYANKHRLEIGDKISLKQKYNDEIYEFQIDCIYEYPSVLAVFIERESFNNIFKNEPGSFNGYFSDRIIDDINEKFIASEITEDDLTKTTRQLKVSMGNMMSLFLIFGCAMFMMIVYLLSKIIIEKNAKSISMTKILGYTDREINGLYMNSTTIMIILSMVITIFISSIAMKKICIIIFSQYPGWIVYNLSYSVYFEMAALGILSYAAVAFLQMRKIKKIPKSTALRNAE